MTGATLASRLDAQLLTGRAGGSVEDVVGRILAVQAQDPRGARLAVRARTRGLTAKDVDRALTDDRSVVIGDLNRGTLHLVLAEDYWWLHSLTAPQLLTGIERRLGQEGVSARAKQTARRTIARELADRPRTRAQVREALEAAGVPTTAQGLYHLLALACVEGVAVRGPMVAGEHAFVDATGWLGPRPPLDRSASLARLAERYLAGHGPAQDRDLARWAGIPLRDARSGLAAVSARLLETADGLELRSRTPPEAPAPGPVLLGAFDPLLLGWRSRADVLGAHADSIVSGAVFRAFALVRGRAAGRWRIDRGHVRLEPLEPWDAPVAEQLAIDAADVERFLA